MKTYSIILSFVVFFSFNFRSYAGYAKEAPDMSVNDHSSRHKISRNHISPANEIQATAQNQEAIPSAKVSKTELRTELKKSHRAGFSKEQIKNLRHQLKEARRTGLSGGDNQLVAIIVAIFLPFIGVLIYEGEVTTHFWIALLLTFLFWLPGFIYALLVITGSIG